MITLKAVLVGSSAIGALAIGGFAFATVAQPDTDLRSDAVRQAPAKPAKPAAPVAPAPPARPKCVPQQLPGAGNAVPQPGAARDTLEQQAGAAREAVEQQAGKAQGAPVAQPRTLPQTNPGQPAAPGVPAVPDADCLPDKLPKKVAPPAVPAKPELPRLPLPKKISCDTVKPAIPVGGKLEKSVILSRGLGHATKHVGVVKHKTHKLCRVTQHWTGAAGQWLKVERVKAPTGYRVEQVREALRLPGGVPTTVGGMQGWQSPLGGAVLWSAPDGFAVLVSGSPAYATQVPEVAAQLQQAAQQVQ
jgi:hypothetical protein